MPLMLTAAFDYDFPESRIAQHPRPRGASRLLILDRSSGQIRHSRVRELPAHVRPGDVLLLNDTRVLPARLHVRRPTGRRFELLLLERSDADAWIALVRPSARARVGERLQAADRGVVVLEECLGEGRWRVTGEPRLTLERLERVGETPLPPYVHRPDGPSSDDARRYQTVFADRPGAVAAPTAGLHLTPELVDGIGHRGVEVVRITLHVGLGTFRPVATEMVEQHRMHRELYEIEPAAARALNGALRQKQRIVCAGTTSVRALEAAVTGDGGVITAGRRSTNLFLHPGSRFRATGAMLTNFHFPRSSLLMLVAGFAGLDPVLSAYAEAVERGYRLFSFGDAMLII